jgi:hypothetical protein
MPQLLLNGGMMYSIPLLHMQQSAQAMHIIPLLLFMGHCLVMAVA